MKQALVIAGFGIGLVLCGAADAQETATVRGTVVDDNGQPVPEVAVEFQYKGESRQKITRSTVSDKKGHYIRSGIRSGDWTVVFSKDGYKTGKLDTSFQAGGMSELPPVKLSPAPSAPAAAAGAAAAAPGDVAAGSNVGAERAKKLSAMYEKAVTAMNAGDAAGSEALFQSIVAELPNLAEAHYNLGVLQALRNDPTSAEAEFRKVIELQPKMPNAYVALATLLSAQGKTEDAYGLLQGVSSDFEKSAWVQFALGANAFNLGRNAEAEVAFGRVVELDPTNAETYFYLGSLALNRNDSAGAIQRLEKYVAIAPATAENVAAAKNLLVALKKK
jgi:Flp pilus assembly protein TadD